jgi:pimeloyl-ACP methyl ester carboxylesterase
MRPSKSIGGGDFGMRLLFILTLLVSTGSAGHAAAPLAPAGVKLDTGEIDGARFVVARPAQWNGSVLLIAHGFRDEKAPLVPDLNPEQLACRTLLDRGWIVAKTSYRRNGMIIRDAISDMENLRFHIAATCGEPQRVLLEGDSMGGAIVILIAEQFPGHYQGAVAVDADLQMRNSRDPLAFNLQPQIPVVFLTNQSELQGPIQYIMAPFDPQHRSLLLEIRRDGSGNVSQRERLVALRTLIDRIDGQPITLPRIAGVPPRFDATQAPVPIASQVSPLPEGGFEAHVTELSAIDGNLVLDAQPSDFSAADIAPGTWFELIANGQSICVIYDKGLARAGRGAWVSFPNADGFCSVVRSHENAAATAGLHTGDAVIIHRLAGDQSARWNSEILDTPVGPLIRNDVIPRLPLRRPRKR